MNIGFDPKLFTKDTLKLYFDKSCNLIPINFDLFKSVTETINKNNLVYSINNSITGESSKNKIKRLTKIIKKKK